MGKDDEGRHVNPFGIHKNSIARNLGSLSREQRALYFKNRKKFLGERANWERWASQGRLSGAEVLDSEEDFDMERLWDSQEVLGEDEGDLPLWENRGEADWEVRDLLKDGAHIEKEVNDAKGSRE